MTIEMLTDLIKLHLLRAVVLGKISDFQADMIARSFASQVSWWVPGTMGTIIWLQEFKRACEVNAINMPLEELLA